MSDLSLNQLLTHPSLIRDRLRQLGYRLISLDHEELSNEVSVLHDAEVDDAIYMALTGNEDFVRFAAAIKKSP